MRSARWTCVALGLTLTLGLDVARAAPLRVLVTNDDGVGAPGIDALVTALAANAQLEITVVAPATANPSETGDQISKRASRRRGGRTDVEPRAHHHEHEHRRLPLDVS